MMHATSFHERLAVEMTLTIGGVEHVIPGGAVKHVELDLELYGFTGTIELVLQDDVEHGGGFSDELRPGFLSPALAEVRVSLAPVFDQAEAAASPEPLVLSGLVTRRSLAELHGGSLRIRSQEGVGTIVLVHLPLTLGSAAASLGMPETLH